MIFIHLVGVKRVGFKMELCLRKVGLSLGCAQRGGSFSLVVLKGGWVFPLAKTKGGGSLHWLINLGLLVALKSL
jgi:hypothetical protein